MGKIRKYAKYGETDSTLQMICNMREKRHNKHEENFKYVPKMKLNRIKED